MSDNIDLKALWNEQESDIPTKEFLMEKANKFKKKNVKKLITVNVVGWMTILYLGFIVYFFQPAMTTTVIGIALVFLAMIIFLVAYNMKMSLLRKDDLNHNSHEYLQQLLKIKEKQRFMQTTMISVYFLLFSVGMGLYMIEYVLKMPQPWGIVAYSLFVLWLGINWFVFRPRVIRKQRLEIDELIEKFRGLNEQFD